MRAIILAAGMGTRMHVVPEGAPVCMLPFGGETVLERMVEVLAECGVPAESVTLVLGYGAENVSVPTDVQVVLNTDYAITDNSRSLQLALEVPGGCDGGVLVLDANMVISVEALRALLVTGKSAALVVEGQSESCRTGVLADAAGRLIALGKHLPADMRHFGGALYLAADHARALLAKLGEGRCDRDWYTVPLNELLGNMDVRVILTPYPVVKMGTDAEYLYAKRLFGVDKLSVLLIGASGFLGKKMKTVLSRRYDVASSSRSGGFGLIELDPLDSEKVTAVFEVCRPDIVVNLVGLADPESCDEDQALAYDLNVRVVENLASVCRERGASLVQVSTDYVFDGDSVKPYATDAVRRPKSYYGTTKKIAEDIVMSLPRSLVVRVPVLYGYNGPGDKPTFPIKVLKALEAGEQFVCDDLQTRFPVLIDDACEAVAARIADTGVLHVSSPEPVTKFDWARAVAREFNLDESLVIRSDLPVKANRPLHVRLSLDEGGFEARGIVEGTRAMARQMSCSFDLVYRCKPMDSVGPVRVADFRLEMGRTLARLYQGIIPDDIDFVAPVPNSGLYYAMGFAEESGIPYLQALVKQDPGRRSYQLQSLAERETVLKGNVLPIRELVVGKRIALIDEAIFTGVTIRTVCDALRACGALSVDVFIPTPVCEGRCPYGVQPDRAMLAEDVAADGMANYFRVRSVRFGARGDFELHAREAGPKTCTECFIEPALSMYGDSTVVNEKGSNA